MILGIVGSRDCTEEKVLMEGSPLDPDGRMAPMRELRDRLKAHGIEMMHYEDAAPETTPGYLFINFQKREFDKVATLNRNAKKFLVVFESEVVYPQNWDLKVHGNFDVVFTWDAQPLPESSKPLYVRFYWPNDLKVRVTPLDFREKKGMFVMIAANKWKRRPKELYSERFNAIDWFKRNHPDQLDLYGYDWNYTFPQKVKEVLRNMINPVLGRAKRPIEVSPMYKGTLAKKVQVLKKYRYCLCYENAEAIPGYVTEKIFDCFFAGVVPVYLGWDGVSSIIPEDTFIDKRKFSSYEEMYRYVAGLGPKEYEKHIKAAEAFMESEAMQKFTPQCFAETILKGITGCF